MKTTNIFGALTTLALAMVWANSTYAVPTVQLGVCLDDPGNGCDGYIANQSIGGDEDTAFTTTDPFKLSIGGVQSQDDVVQLGKVYDTGGQKGDDWSGFGLPSAFDGKGAILVVSAPDGLMAEDYAGGPAYPFTVPITVNGSDPFYADEANSFKGDQHFPAKDSVSDFLFFDIGNIFGPLDWSIDTTTNPNNPAVDVDTSGLSQVSNFQDPSDPNNLGAISILDISIDESLVDWLHFDVIALQTSIELDVERAGGRITTTIVSTATVDESNPNSKDVTWYKEGEEPPIPPAAVPEPSLLWLLGGGLVGVGLARRMRRQV